ncbi:MAG: glutaminase A, partial [Nitrospirales bacterium]
MNRNPIASIGSPIQKYLETVHACYRDLDEGEVASYIPELFEADPHWFGICIATSDGQIYEVGESRRAFTIQSISKPFVYGMAMEDCGVEHVLAKIGLEPSGDAFNSISLHPETGCPLNPMINAGAITTTSLVGSATAGAEGVPRMRRILETFERYVAHEVAVDEEVYRSESATGHRNRAIGYMLRNFKIIEEDPMPSLDDYFRQCSISADCRDLAVMGATLANGGVNPLSGVRALDARHVENVLSVMTSCGMYDYAGEWIYRVGMPAKSGVAGGILAVLPGQLGIGVYSPPLD